jgi:hypothetical protein
VYARHFLSSKYHYVVRVCVHLEVTGDRCGAASPWEPQRNSRSWEHLDGRGISGTYEASIRKVDHTRNRREVVPCKMSPSSLDLGVPCTSVRSRA